MKKLDRGSVILFGSRLDHRFVLDTVFVVDRWDEYRPDNNQSLKTTSAYRAVGLAPIFDDAKSMKCRGDAIEDESFRLYHGATLENSVAGMFSCFPCLIAQSSDGFPRPTIRISEIANDNKVRGYKLSGPFSLEVTKFCSKVLLWALGRKCQSWRLEGSNTSAKHFAAVRGGLVERAEAVSW